MEYDAIILGGGLTGLFVGYKLSKKKKRILLIEKSKELGGLLGSFKTKGDPLEKYYHHVFKGDKNFLELIKELGVDDRFHWTESTLGFYWNGEIHDLSTPLKIISFKPLNISEKIQFIKIAAKIKLTKNTKKLEVIPAKKWIIENSGKKIYDKFFYPMLRSKYGENLDRISAGWFLERIKLRTKGGIGKEKLGYLRGGFQILIKSLEDGIVKNGGEIVKGCSIEKISIKNDSIDGVILDGKKIETRCLVSTIPLPELAKFKELPSEFRRRITSIEYQGAVCVILGLDRRLTDFYWTNIIEPYSIGAIIEHTNFQPIENYKDHIVYLASYPDRNSDVWILDDKKVFNKYFNDLKKLFPSLEEKNVRWWKVFKDKQAGLVYDMNFSEKLIGNKTPIEGLFIGGMFNNYPERSIEGSIKDGKNILKLIEKFD